MPYQPSCTLSPFRTLKEILPIGFPYSKLITLTHASDSLLCFFYSSPLQNCFSTSQTLMYYLDKALHFWQTHYKYSRPVQQRAKETIGYKNFMTEETWARKKVHLIQNGQKLDTSRTLYRNRAAQIRGTTGTFLYRAVRTYSSSFFY